MRRFVMLSVLLLVAIPFGVSISGCSKSAPIVYCNGGDSGIVTGQATSIVLRAPSGSTISLNYAQIGASSQPSATDCKGQSAATGYFTYATTDMTIADVQPTTGRLCGGTWNRNSGGGIADYTVCNPTSKTGVAYLTASAAGVASNPVPMFVHPVITSIVLGADAPSGVAAPLTSAITAYSITASTPTFTGPNTYTAGQVLSLYGFPRSTFFNGISNATVLAAGLSSIQFSVSVPAQSNPANTLPATALGTLEDGFAGAPDCTTNPTTACCPLVSVGSPSATTYTPDACISQGQTRQLAARVYAGTGTSQSNITCQVGQLTYGVSGTTSSSTAVSPVLSIDNNGIATANQPGSVLISAYITNAASSAGFFSTCPPARITLSVPGQTGNGPFVINQNNTQPLVATAYDTLGNPLTGLDLNYESTAQSTVPTSLATVTPQLAGEASVSAICQPPACNASAYNQIGLFGNGKPITSNSVDFISPGSNSTVLYMASTQSKYIVARDFTQNSLSAALLLPYVPNSMVINPAGTTIYLGSPTALMVLNAGSALSIARVDQASQGSVLTISQDGSEIVISDPIKQIITIEGGGGNVIASYGGVASRAEFSPDGSTLYVAAGNQLLTYSTFTGWNSITPSSPITDQPPFPVKDVAVTVPAVGAYLAGPTTTARNYCSTSTLISAPNSSNPLLSNEFYPQADTSAVASDRIAATNDGLHVLGAIATPSAMLNDLRVEIPNGNSQGPGNAGGAGALIACPLTGTLMFSNTVAPTPLAAITATAITGVVPTSDSSEAFITYTGTGGVLPAYAPVNSGAGTIKYIKLSGAATAPIAGVVSTDNTTFYAGTSGDNLVHIISRSTLSDTSTLAPNLIAAPDVAAPVGSIVPVDLLVQKPRTSN
jgi:hypothetical protein